MSLRPIFYKMGWFSRIASIFLMLIFPVVFPISLAWERRKEAGMFYEQAWTLLTRGVRAFPER